MFLMFIYNCNSLYMMIHNLNASLLYQNFMTNSSYSSLYLALIISVTIIISIL